MEAAVEADRPPKHAGQKPKMTIWKDAGLRVRRREFTLANDVLK